MHLILGLVLLVALLLGFWLFALAPRIKTPMELALLRQFDYAHRGLHDKRIPENSLAAFGLAADKGFGMELDLQLTKDHYVVVHHDDDLSRLCGVSGRISQMTLAALAPLRLLGTDQGIPLFCDVLKLVNGRTPLIVELKGYNNQALLCQKAWALLQRYKGLYCVESFDPMIVRWFYKRQPQVVRGQLMAAFHKGDAGLNTATAFLGRNLFCNVLTRPDFVAYHYHHRKKAALRIGRKLFSMQEASWTVTDPQTFCRLKQDGCICIFEGFDPQRIR